MPPDPLEVVGPRAHQVPWLAPASRYAPVQHYKCARVRVCLHACVCEYMLPTQVAKCTRVSDTVHACHP